MEATWRQIGNAESVGADERAREDGGRGASEEGVSSFPIIPPCREGSRCRENMAHIRQFRPDFVQGVKAKVLTRDTRRSTAFPLASLAPIGREVDWASYRGNSLMRKRTPLGPPRGASEEGLPPLPNIPPS